MKKYFICGALCLAAVAANAQSSVLNNPSNRAYFGLRASYDLSLPGDVKVGDESAKMFGAGSGVGLGVVYNQPLVANLFLEPGLTLYYNTESIGGDALEDMEDLFDHRSTRKFGMLIPVQLGYHFDFTPSFNVSLMTGPVLNVGFSDDYYLTSTEIGDNKYHLSGSLYNDDGLNRVDCAWRVGLGFNFGEHYFLGVSGDFGLCNMLNDDLDGKMSWHDNALHITLGYNF